MRLFPNTPKGFLYALISFFILVLIVYGSSFFISEDAKAPTLSQNQNANTSAQTNAEKMAQQNINNSNISDDTAVGHTFQVPLDNFSQRITKKPFGKYITPEMSSVQPEKFSGFHTGIDFEILSGEENADVLVRAICDGSVLVKQRVSGYGGVFIQSCTINEQPETVLYGHLALESISLSIGDYIKGGDSIGFLGAGNSYDTDGERKHLHLGIHKGSEINYRGYVATESELGAWIDFETVQ